MESSSSASQGGLGLDLVSFAFDGPVTVDDQKPLYIDAECPSRSLNAAQTRLLVRKFIAGFKQAGLKQGDRVVVHLFNNYLYSALFFAVVGAGGVYAGSNPSYQFFELDHLFKLAEPQFVITSHDLLPGVLAATKASSIPPSNIFCLDAASLDVAGTTQAPLTPPGDRADSFFRDESTPRNVADLLEHGEKDWLRIQDEALARATPAAYFTTSGTSGLPKAAVISHAALISHHRCIYQDVPYQVTRLMCLPSFHILGCLFIHMHPVRYGEPLYVFPRFNLDSFVQAIHRFRITDTVMSPPMLFALNASSLPLRHLLQTLRYVLCGGEKLMAAPQQEFYKHLSPNAVFSQVWGMTEIGAVTLFRWPEQDFSGSVGRAGPGCEIKLVDGNGNIINSDSQLGEAYVRTSNVMTKYKVLGPAQPSIIDDDGWVSTGDVFSMQNGKYYVQGRAKELIKVKGWQVSPAEIEIVLRQHPQIADVAVSGILREDGLTEVPRAYVVRKTNVPAHDPLNAEDVYNFSRARLASYKALDGGVVFVNHIPRTATGKVQRFKLRDLTKEVTVLEDLIKHCTALAGGALIEKRAPDQMIELARRRSLSRKITLPTGDNIPTLSTFRTPPDGEVGAMGMIAEAEEEGHGNSPMKEGMSTKKETENKRLKRKGAPQPDAVGEDVRSTKRRATQKLEGMPRRETRAMRAATARS